MTVDTGIMTRVLNQFLSVFSAGAESLGTEAAGLLSVLIAIEIVWAGLMWSLGGGDDFFKAFTKKLMHIGIFTFITLNFATIAQVIMDGFIWAGMEIGGGALAISTLRDPSKIIDMGFVATAEIWLEAANAGMMSPGAITLILMMITSLAIMIGYFLVALQVFMTLIEFYLIASFGVIMIPWGLNRHTAFIAERYFGAIVAQGVKLMVTIAVLSIVLPVLEGLVLGQNPSFSECMALLFGVMTIQYVVKKAPEVASGLMTGAANLQGGDVLAGPTAAAAGAINKGGAMAGAAITAATGGAGAPVAAAGIAATGAAASGVSGGVQAAVGSGSSGSEGAKGGGKFEIVDGVVEAKGDKNG